MIVVDLGRGEGGFFILGVMIESSCYWVYGFCVNFIVNKFGV